MKSLVRFTLVGLAIVPSLLAAQTPKPPIPTARREDAAMNKWRENRFGLFIHWGVYSVPGGIWNGKRVGAAEWIQAQGKISPIDYAKFPADFTAKNFNAKNWAKAAKQIGAKYVVITTKHHDGFCLWDSKYTDWDLQKSPAPKDLLKQLADAVRAEGMDFGVYYSILDWHHPDYRTNLKSDADRKAFERYIVYMKSQLKELVDTLGPIKVFWFDGRWEPSYKENPTYGADLEKYCRQICPGVVINDRIRAYDSYADYDSGYERKLPENELPPVDWEACMTMPEGTWGYHSDPPGNGWKTPQTLLNMLLKCASKNGNFLLNIGPKSDGTIRKEEAERMKAVGEWMRFYGNAVYGTQGLVLKSTTKFYATRKKDSIYLTFFEWPETDRVTIEGLPSNIASAQLLDHGKGSGLKVEGNTIILPMTPPEKLANVVEIKLKQ